jgi:hypothetical protein
MLMAGSVNYFEVGTPDADATAAFYGQLFGWQIGAPSNGYRMVDGDKGGIADSSSMGGGYAIFYVQVEDVAATLAQAERLGAQVLIPATDNGAIEFAHLQDPHGNRFGVWRPNG